MRFKSIFIIAVLFPLLCLSQQQVQKTKDTVLTQQLNEVVVTATRTIRQLSSLPLPVQIIAKKELKETGSTRLDAILNEQTGLITVQNFIGGEGIQMQGLESEYTLVLIDGVPLIGRSAGTLDLSRLSVGNIKQIEIVKGASSSLYGSEALGGVINIITDKSNRNGIHGNLMHRFGTFNEQETNINLDYKKERITLGAFINRSSSNGYDLNNATNVNTLDPYFNYTFNTKLSYDITENTNLFASTRYFLQDSDYIPTDTEAGESEVREWNAHLKANHKYNEKWSSYFEFYASRYFAKDFLNNVEDNTLFSESFYKEVLIRPEIRATYKVNNKSSFIGGLGLDYEALNRADFSTTPKLTSPFMYLQYDTNPKEDLNIILGARFDGHNEYNSQFSPKVAFRYQIFDKLAAKGSVGYGFKAPDFRQLYFDLQGIAGYTILGYNVVNTRIPEMLDSGEIGSENDIVVPLSNFNDKLNPENSISYNFGVTYNPISELKLEVNYFRNDIKDLIDNQLIANKTNGSGVYSYQNIKKAFTQGIEFNSSWRISNSLKIAGGYQFLLAKDKAAVESFKNGGAFASFPGQSAFQLKESDYFGLFNRSKHMANFKVFYSNTQNKFNTNIRGTYRSKYGVLDTNSNTYLDKYDDFVDAYTMWNWAINKTFKENYELGIGVDNIFDFTDEPTSNNDFTFINNIPGRIFFTKLNIQF